MREQIYPAKAASGYQSRIHAVLDSGGNGGAEIGSRRGFISQVLAQFNQGIGCPVGRWAVSPGQATRKKTGGSRPRRSCWLGRPVYRQTIRTPAARYATDCSTGQADDDFCIIHGPNQRPITAIADLPQAHD